MKLRNNLIESFSLPILSHAKNGYCPVCYTSKARQTNKKQCLDRA